MKIFSCLSLIAFAAQVNCIRMPVPSDTVTYKKRWSMIPGWFKGEGSDALMNTIIGNYAQEKFVNNNPTGEYSLDKESFEKVALEVVGKYV